MKKLPVLVGLLVFVSLMAIASVAHAVDETPSFCGDGIVQFPEECDTGSTLSDLRPNACRSDCRLFYCGDFVVDGGEECDDGRHNSNELPNACRPNCKRAHCGDGIVDDGEECDDCNDGTNRTSTWKNFCYRDGDGWVVDDPACATCKQCYRPPDFVTQNPPLIFGQGAQREEGEPVNDDAGQATKGVTERLRGPIRAVPDRTIVRLCPGNYKIALPDNNSVLIQIGDNIELDCQGASFEGERRGTVFSVEGKNVVLRNCKASKYNVGAHIGLGAENAVLIENTICQNVADIISESYRLAPAQSTSYGVLNKCGSDWRIRLGATDASCMYRCPQIVVEEGSAQPIIMMTPGAQPTGPNAEESQRQRTILRSVQPGGTGSEGTTKTKSFWQRLFQKQ